MFKLSNIIFLITSFFCFFSLVGQINSFEFKSVLPPGGTLVNQVDQNYFGRYAAEDDWLRYRIDATGIYIETITHLSISRETIRETSTYDVRNGYIFGVIEGDSLRCILQDGKYYFGIINETQIAGSGSHNRLTRQRSGEYILNFFEDQTYTPSRLKFTGQQLEIAHFDYEDGTSVFDEIRQREITDNKIILDPTLQDWQAVQHTVFMAPVILKKMNQ
jgi:hypothetical protein